MRWRSCPKPIKRILKTQLGKLGNSNCASKSSVVRLLGNCDRLTRVIASKGAIERQGSIHTWGKMQSLVSNVLDHIKDMLY